MAESLESAVRRRAASRCEYCHLPERLPSFRHTLDHITAQQHRGKTEFDNLALCCLRCNQHKGPNLTGIDPESDSIVTLFHPRHDSWDEHFRYSGPVLIGLTPTGRATIAVLAINHPLRIT